METPAASEITRPVVLFIGGLGRSGSTLLDLMLGQQQGFVAVGELSYIWRRGVLENERCGCGASFHDCPFWTKVGDVAFGGWDNVDGRSSVALRSSVDRNRYVPMLLAPQVFARFDRRFARYAARLEALYRAIAEVSGSNIIVDSTKHASTAYLLQRLRNVDLRIVHLVRDGRGVAYSWTKHVRKPEVSTDDAYLDRYHPARIGLRWIGYNAMFHLLRARRGTTSLFLQYEDLVRDPRRQVARITRFAGSPTRAEDIVGIGDDWVTIREEHTIAGNPVRFANDRLDLKVDQEWRERMPSWERRLVSAIGLPLLVRYGYLPENRR